jgi:Tol biopolymer transport system component
MFLFVVDTETGEREQITSHTRTNAGARFAPDGRTIAYTSDRTGNLEIWLHHLGEGHETQFTDDEATDLWPAWSPDGRRLLFMSDRDGGGFRWYIATADGGGGSRRLVDLPINWLGPLSHIIAASRWSPSGESIGYVVVGDEGAELWTIAPEGEGARRRVDDIAGFDWYGGDRQVIVTRLRGSEKELIAVDLETGREQTLFVGALREIDVAPDGSAVAFCFGRGHASMGLAVLKLEPPSEPYGLPAAIGEPEYVVRTEGTWHIHLGGWSADSRKLVYTRDWDYGDIYELIERP